MRRKAKAEAENAEVDTVKNMQDVVSNMQGAYDKMLDQVNHYIEDATGKMEEMRSERDRYAVNGTDSEAFKTVPRQFLGKITESTTIVWNFQNY